jgi:hypothetical protein
VPLANGCARGDVWAVRGGDAIGLTSAGSVGEGRVEPEVSSVRVHVFSMLKQGSDGWGRGLLVLARLERAGEGPGGGSGGVGSSPGVA